MLSKCSSRCHLEQLESIDIGTCEMWVRTEGTATILISATAACATKLCNFFDGGAECMCWLGCAWRGQVCMWADHWTWIGFRCLCREWPSIKMYAKCGSIEDARSVFNKMPSQDVVTLNAILRGCAMQLLGREALQQFEQMCEELYSQMIWLLFVFYQLCGHAGLVDEGICCYASIITVYMVSAKLEHCTACSSFLAVLVIYRRQRI